MKTDSWVFVTDIDGTLDYKCQGIGAPVIKSAREYVKAGGALALATGRSIISTTSIAQSLQVNTPSILYGGAMIYDFANNSSVWKCALSGDIMCIVKDILLHYEKIAVIVYTDQGISILSDNDIIWKSGIPQECKKEFFGATIEGNILKITMCGNHEQVQQIGSLYFSTDEYDFAFSSRHFAEVVSPKAGKGKALEQLSILLQVPLERFFAMGDALNDLSMLKLAGFAYSLENANDRIKQVANHILPHCQNNGAAKGFSHALNRIASLTSTQGDGSFVSPHI